MFIKRNGREIVDIFSLLTGKMYHVKCNKATVV